jgi:hypothetical protein
MGCNCGNKAGAKRTLFLATFTDGTQKTYVSEVEAQLAVARKGGSYRKQS